MPTETAYKRVEKEVRCSACGRMSAKLIVSFDADVHKEADVKVGIETKCARCGQLDNKLYVI